jgi:hypothetical protein
MSEKISDEDAREAWKEALNGEDDPNYCFCCGRLRHDGVSCDAVAAFLECVCPDWPCPACKKETS